MLLSVSVVHEIFCWCWIDEDIQWNRTFELSSLSAYMGWTGWPNWPIDKLVKSLPHNRHNNIHMSSSSSSGLKIGILGEASNRTFQNGQTHQCTELSMGCWFIFLDIPRPIYFVELFFCKHCLLLLCWCQSDRWVSPKLDTFDQFVIFSQRTLSHLWLGNIYQLAKWGRWGIDQNGCVETISTFLRSTNTQTHKYTKAQRQSLWWRWWWWGMR